jgi:hypothetical protein
MRPASASGAANARNHRPNRIHAYHRHPPNIQQRRRSPSTKKKSNKEEEVRQQRKSPTKKKKSVILAQPESP